jgi:hypothetical protein
MVSEPADVAARAGIDTSVAHHARMWDYLLGGKDNFAADRAAADALAQAWPGIRIAAWEDRAFLRRAITYLASWQGGGLRQFLDVGTGLPRVDATHQVAQAITPGARVVYVDNDPLVLVHARALLISVTPEGMTSYVDADLRRPQSILEDPNLRGTLDLSEPVVLVLGAVLHLLSDADDPDAIVGTLMAALPPGSALVATHGSLDELDEETIGSLKKTDWGQFVPRTAAEIQRFFDGLDVQEPGVTMVSRWRRDPERDGPLPSDDQVSMYGGVALKPRYPASTVQ